MEVDALLPDVLLFPAGADLHAHPLVQSHCLVLQVRGGPPERCLNPVSPVPPFNKSPPILPKAPEGLRAPGA